MRTLVLVILLGIGRPDSIALADDPPLRLNQIQVIGTHNSYHIAPGEGVGTLIAAGGKGRAEGLDYSHRPLPSQFTDQKIRQIELDVFADPRGGHYAQPAARTILAAAGKDPGPDPNQGGVLDKPGMKVLHVPDLDYGTTAPTLAVALSQVRDWSRANPRHVPIMILIELKDDAIPALPTRPIPFDEALLDAVDAEILAVFERSHLVTPDDVRGPYASLPEAIRERGWPILDAVRGKIMFALDNEGSIRDRYVKDHPALKGRVMFASVEPTDPAAAWFKINDPVREFDTIQQRVRDGFLVRTRADADTKQARRNDPSQRDRALASGAQFVSTDYPDPREEWSPYCVRLPDRVAARPNPVSAPGKMSDVEGPTVIP